MASSPRTGTLSSRGPKTSYSTRQRAEIMDFLAQYGSTATEVEYGVPRCRMHQWRKPPPARRTDDEVKVAVVLDYAMCGNLTQVAKRHGCAISSVYKWAHGIHINEDVRVMLEEAKAYLEEKGAEAAALLLTGITPEKVESASVKDLGSAFGAVTGAVVRLTTMGAAEPLTPPSPDEALERMNELLERGKQRMREAQEKAVAGLPAPAGPTYVMRADGTLEEQP